MKCNGYKYVNKCLQRIRLIFISIPSLELNSNVVNFVCRLLTPVSTQGKQVGIIIFFIDVWCKKDLYVSTLGSIFGEQRRQCGKHN